MAIEAMAQLIHEVDFPIKHADLNHSCVSHYQRVHPIYYPIKSPSKDSRAPENSEIAKPSDDPPSWPAVPCRVH